MTTAFESIQWADIWSISHTIVPAAIIMNNAFLYFIKTVLPSKPLTQPKITSYRNAHFILEIFKKKVLISEFEIILKRRLIIFTLVSSIASLLNLNEFHIILCVSKTALNLSTGFLSMLRCERWSCYFKEANKRKNVVSEIAVCF